ncbi:unnamed protein product [Gongylonema pulchrum]|uniref:Transposase n=1 Tax=Gongylonema pulchrum TaxID=637853 RepID=A0A183E2W0_9BILA|nr:unnamed protein product [Gongylonema pulchrum]
MTLNSGFKVIETSVGPIICGKGLLKETNLIQTACYSTQEAKKSEINFDEFWKLETIRIIDPPEITDDELAMKQFEKIVQYSDGRYSVKWPWKSESNALTDSNVLCLGRLKSTVRRLNLDPELFERYDQNVQRATREGSHRNLRWKDRWASLLHATLSRIHSPKENNKTAHRVQRIIKNKSTATKSLWSIVTRTCISASTLWYSLAFSDANSCDGQ